MSLFEQVEVIAAPTSASKDDVVRVEVAGLHDLAVVSDASDALKTVEARMAEAIKTGPVLDYFVTEGVRTKSRPASFRGVDGQATASCVLRERTSALKPAEVELCKKHGFKTEEKTTVLGAFVLNPKHANKATLDLISALLKDQPGIPDDLFMWQEPQTTTVVPAGALDDLFKKRGEKAIRALAPVVGQLVVTPSLNEDTLTDSLARLGTLLDEQKAASAAEAATKAAEKAAKAKDKADKKAKGKK